MATSDVYPWKKTAVLWLIGIVALGFVLYLHFSPDKPLGASEPGIQDESKPLTSVPWSPDFSTSQARPFLVFPTPQSVPTDLPLFPGINAISTPVISSKIDVRPAPTPYLVGYVIGEAKSSESAENTGTLTPEASFGVECTCASGACNPRTSECVAPASVPEEKIGQLVSEHVAAQGIELKDYRVVDSFFDDRPVKLALLDCGSTSQVVCSILLTIDSDGKVLHRAVAR